MRILLMEDDPVLGDIITDYLQTLYKTDRAFDSKEAQEKSNLVILFSNSEDRVI